MQQELSIRNFLHCLLHPRRGRTVMTMQGRMIPTPTVPLPTHHRLLFSTRIFPASPTLPLRPLPVCHRNNRNNNSYISMKTFPPPSLSHATLHWPHKLLVCDSSSCSRPRTRHTKLARPVTAKPCWR